MFEYFKHNFPNFDASLGQKVLRCFFSYFSTLYSEQELLDNPVQPGDANVPDNDEDVKPLLTTVGSSYTMTVRKKTAVCILYNINISLPYRHL